METKGLAAALVKAQKEMKGAVKDTVNPFFKSKYADLGSVWEACHKALSDNGFSIIQAGSFHDGHFFLKTTLLHESGESVNGEYLIKPTKEDPQGYGSAWTYARRYSLASMVGVISEDDDGNAAGQVAEPSKAVKEVFANQAKTPANPPSHVTGGSIPGAISEAQGKRFYAIAKSNGKSDDDIKDYLGAKLNVQRSNHIQKKDYDDACAWAASAVSNPDSEVPF